MPAQAGSVDLAANHWSMDLKGLVADHFGHFALKDLANLTVSVFAAAVFGALVAAYGARQSRTNARSGAVWAALFAAAVGLARTQLPLAVALVAMALLLHPIATKPGDRRVMAGMLVIGLACGSGATVVGALLAVLLLVLYRWVGLGAEATDDK